MFIYLNKSKNIKQKHFTFNGILMKKIILATSAIILGSAAAHAADGTVTITGKITDKTCSIDAKSKDLTVALPTVSVTSLAASGQTAGRTPFTINLTGCSEGKVATYFEPGDTVDFSSGRLNTTGGATNVQVQLLGDNNQVIPVLAKTAGTQLNSQEVSVSAGGSAALNYYAEYYAKDKTTAGDVKTSVKYTIVYP